MTGQELARYIDHTYLKVNANFETISKLCLEARENKFKAVCIPPIWVAEANKLLEGTNTEVCTVIGFPLGYATTNAKGKEAYEAVRLGATEVDMVIPVGLLKSGFDDKVKKDISYVVESAKSENHDALVKVIIECCFLTDSEKKQACLLAKSAGADFVKTSTGFGSGGATVEDVKLMRSVVGEQMGVKAAGGIRTTEDALAMIQAGANRIGTSNGVDIVNG